MPRQANADIFTEYKRNTAMELEVRLRNMDAKSVVSILDSASNIMNKKFVDMFDYGEQEKRGMRMHFNGNETNIEGIHKSIISRDLIDSGSIVLSKEESIDPATIDDGFHPTMFKQRFSFDHPDDQNWTVDVTVTRAISSQNNNLKGIKQSFFDSLDTYQKLREEIISNPKKYSYEVELEHKPFNKNVKKDDIPKLVNSILLKANPENNNNILYISELRIVAKYLLPEDEISRKTQSATIKFITPQVKHLDKTMYMGIFPPAGYYATPKADGNRCIAMIHDKKCILLHSVYEAFPAPAYNGQISIADCEYFEKEKLLLVFDMIVFEGQSVADSILTIRIKPIKRFCETFSKHSGITAVDKPYVSLGSQSLLKEALQEVYKSPKPYNIDGIIFTQVDAPYSTAVSYKWKRVEDHTIDFHSWKCPDKLLGRPPYNRKDGYILYLIFVTIRVESRNKLNLTPIPEFYTLYPELVNNHDRRVPIQFTTPICPLAYLYYHKDSIGVDINGKIIELAAGDLTDDKTIDWKFVKVRDDKTAIRNMTYGNAYDTALYTLLSYMDPLTFEMLYEGPLQDNYFKVEKSTIYKAATAFNSFVKSQHIDSITNTENLVDISSGKGQDLFRYIKIKINKLVMCDVDKNAIVQLLQRWLGSARAATVPLSTTLIAMLLDVNDDAQQNANLLIDAFNCKFHNLICNFAIHYFAETVATLRNFALMCNLITEPGAILQFTCLNGKRVANELKTADQFDLKENGMVKYSIRKLYPDADLAIAGQKISAIHPFSAGQYIEEFLVNFDTLTEVFKDYQMELIEIMHFESFRDAFRSANQAVSMLMTPQDIKYVSLYSVIKFKRV